MKNRARKIAHATLVDGYFQCNLCKRLLGSDKALSRHRINSHGIKVRPIHTGSKVKAKCDL
jgi:uncharacterized C2H2 Zn-finger protein